MQILNIVATLKQAVAMSLYNQWDTGEGQNQTTHGYIVWHENLHRI